MQEIECYSESTEKQQIDVNEMQVMIRPECLGDLGNPKRDKASPGAN